MFGIKEWVKKNFQFLLPAWRRWRTLHKRLSTLWMDTKYTLTWLVFELPRGLDFSRRDLSPFKESGGEMCAYQKTSRRRLQSLLADPNIIGGQAFLDIGCGKGYVLKTVSELGSFARLGGIEYNSHLASICQKNFVLLGRGMEHIQIWEGDAQDFPNYEDYDTFFLYNPFGPQIFKHVLEKLPSKRTAIIYFNPVCHDIILDSGRFHLVRQIHENRRDRWPINIYLSTD